MSFIVDTQTKLEKLAHRIKKINPSAANRLFRLSAAVGRVPNSMSDAWAANDVHKMIDAQVIAEQMRAQDIPNLGLRIMEWFRNLLIFIPLVLTWLGISSAVSSYATFVNAVTNKPHADTTQLQLPFLYLWQQGFGGYLPGWLILSKLAFYDFILLLILVFLTGIVNIRTHLRTSSKEREAEELQEQLTDALTDAALCLAKRPGQSSGGSGGGVDVSQQVLDQMEKERQHRDQELVTLKNMVDSLKPISDSMLNGAQFIQQSTDQLRQVLQNLTGPVQQMADGQQHILHEMRQLVTAENSTAQDVKQLVSDQQQWGAALKQATDELSKSAVNLNLLPAAINQWTNQLSGLVNQLTVEHQAQATVTQQTADIAIKLQAALTQIHDAANHLRSMSKDFYDIMNTQKAFPDAVKASLGDVIRDYNNAAASVAQGGNNLAYAARMLYDAANRLNGATPTHS